MLRSVLAVFVGALISLVVGMLVIFGLIAPVLSAIFGLKPEPSTLSSTTPLLVFVAAFSFYFGGMAAGYRARSRRRLHGVAVVAVLSLISPILNLLTGRDPLPQFETPRNALLTAVLLLISLGAAYVGAGRGASLHAFNQRPANERASEHAKQRGIKRFL